MLNILFFTNDPGIHKSVQQAISGEDRSLLMASNYQEAVNMLGHVFISLMVVDFNLSPIKCKALLEHAWDKYPDISAITLSPAPIELPALSDKPLASYVGTPFVMEEFRQVIEFEIQNLTQGGTIANVSPPGFAQLLEMEEKSCILRVFDKTTQDGGVLAFRSGKLVGARTKRLRGMDAACRILAWEEADIFLQNTDYPGIDHIQADLQSIIMKSVHLKDEGGRPPVPPPKKTDAQTLSAYIEKEMGTLKGVDDIFHEPDASKLLDDAQALGDFFDLGRLKLAYADDDTDADIFLPGKKPMVLKLNAQCPRDRITQVITRYLDKI